MFERIAVPGLSDDENATLNLLLERLEAKMPRNLLRASYYDGKRAISQVGTVIPPQYYRLGIMLGWTAKAVDLLARRCTLERFVWPDGDLDSLGMSELASANMLRSKVNSGGISSLIHATAFLVTTKGGEGEPPALLHVKDAMNATGQWNHRKGSLDNLVSVVKRDDDGRPVEFVLYLDGLTITAKKDGGVWEVNHQPHPWGVPAEPLVYKPRVGREFGSSRISRPVMSLQDQALRELIRLEGHMDVYSWPEFWLLGADESIFKNADGTPKASWQVMLGRLKGVPDDQDAQSDVLARADVKQFPAASPQPHLSALNAFAKLFARETSLPDTALAITDVSNPTSAESYDASQYELIAEAEGATDDWSLPLQRTAVRMLAMANGLSAVPAEWSTIAPRWRDPRYLSRAAQADAGMKQLSAVPWLAESEVGLELLGLDEQQIARALADKRRSQGTTALATILDRAAQQQVTSGDAGPTAAQ